MRFEQLEYLLEISKVNSINSASKNLHISQQSLSKAIQNLEEELEVTLLERTNKGVILTNEGKRVVKIAKKITFELEELKIRLKLANKPVQTMHGNLSIMYTNSFDLDKITSSVNAFSAAYPNIKIGIYQKDIHKLTNAILTNEVDLGLISLPNEYNLNKILIGDNLEDLLIFPLFEDKLIAAVSSISPLAIHKSISINSLLKHPLVLLQHDYKDDPEKYWLGGILRQYGTPNFVLTTDNIQLYLKAIADNTGIGFITQSTKKSLRFSVADDIVTLPISPPIRLFYSYVLSRNRPLTLETKAYLPFLSTN